MFPARRITLFASVLTTMVAAPALAQDRSRVSGTMTLTPAPVDREQVLLTRRARLGITVNLRVSPTDSIGALILGVTPNGPAARAGIRSGDIVVRFNGKLVTEGDKAAPEESAPGIRLVKLVSEINPGDSAVVQYRRVKAQRMATVVAGDEMAGNWVYSYSGPGGTGVLRSSPLPRAGVRRDAVSAFDFEIQADSLLFRPDSMLMTAVPLISRSRTPMPMAWVMGSPLANLELAPINPELGKYFGTAEGVLVINLPEDSKLGLKPGDVVLSVNSRMIRSPGHLINVLMSYGEEEAAVFQVMRQKTKQTVTGMVAKPR
jgi:membrane-associated protease RseP (regulator of RpoE activity)